MKTGCSPRAGSHPSFISRILLFPLEVTEPELIFVAGLARQANPRALVRPFCSRRPPTPRSAKANGERGAIYRSAGPAGALDRRRPLVNSRHPQLMQHCIIFHRCQPSELSGAHKLDDAPDQPRASQFPRWRARPSSLGFRQLSLRSSPEPRMIRFSAPAG
jgi:hypothetical protein